MLPISIKPALSGSGFTVKVEDGADGLIHSRGV
jgi:hypothetical protein